MKGLKAVILTAVILCSIAGNLFASVNYVKRTYWKNYGGLNDQLSSTEIEDNEASDIQNMVFDTGGVVKKRFGYTTVSGSSTVISGNVAAITGLAFFKQNDDSKHLIAVARVGDAPFVVKKTYQVGGGLNTSVPWDDINNVLALPSTGYTNNDLVSFAAAENKLVFATNATTQKKPYQWTGSGTISALTSDADCPNATIVTYHKRHLFLSGGSANPSRIYFSALDDITDYTATDFFDVETSDGTKVRGMVSAYDSLYIFKDKSIWRLAGDERDTFSLELMVRGIGTMSHQSIAVVNNVIYFTSNQNDIMVYTGGYEVETASTAIRGTIGGLNFSRANKNLGLAFSTYRYNDQDYYASVSGAGSAVHNKVLLFDTNYEAWTRFKGINANAWCVGEDSVGKQVLFFGDYSGYVHQYPSTAYYDGDNTVSGITAYYQTKWFKYDDVALGDKYWRVLKTYLLSEETSDNFLTIDCRSDYDTSGRSFSVPITQTGSLWDVAYWDTDEWGGQSLIIDRREVEKGKNMFQLYFYHNTVSQGCSIFGWDMFIEPTDRGP